MYLAVSSLCLCFHSPNPHGNIRDLEAEAKRISLFDQLCNISVMGRVVFCVRYGTDFLWMSRFFFFNTGGFLRVSDCDKTSGEIFQTLVGHLYQYYTTEFQHA